MSAKPVVAVAMSGGVDSSVAAALLIERGFTVFGLMLRLWSEETAGGTNRCCTPDSVALARRVAATLSIPFYVLDARQVFYDSVVLPFIDDYAHNLTPNPCVNCNRLIRWDFLFKHAMAAGADYLATGHYSRINQQNDQPIQLMRGVDARKDQSYVLHVLVQNQLAHTLFPLGEYYKAEVRQIAHQSELPVAERPDSQDLCFVGADGDYRGFLWRQAPQVATPGEILDGQGKLLGRHQGLPFFTIGQRKGLRIASPTPLYVLEKDTTHNALIVGPRDQLGCDHLVAARVNWVCGTPPSARFTARVKIRYKALDVPGDVVVLDDNRFRVQFGIPLADITPGQAAVLYNGEVCLGGGIITNRQNNG